MRNYLPQAAKTARQERHFRRLNETSEAVWPVIQDIIANQYKRDRSFWLSNDMELFLKKRLGKPLLRPYLVRLAYELAGGEDWRSILYFMAAVELLNISTYQSNICFDQKADFKNTRQENQYIASMFSYSLAHIAIAQQNNIDEKVRCAALELLARCNLEVYEGQYIDINILTMNRFKYYCGQNGGTNSRLDVKRNFIAEYIHRCELIGGATFAVTVIGAMAVNPDNEIVRLMEACYRKLGVSAQIINDLADFIPEDQQKQEPKYSRPYANSFGDLRMGRLTYPAFLLMKDSATANTLKQIHSVWDYQRPTQEEFSHLTANLKQLNIRGKVESLIRSYAWRGKSGIEASLAEIKSFVSHQTYEDLLFIRPYIFGSSMLLFFSRHANNPL
jgi:geranylgeranyl pyrophosphate synthase